MSSIVSLTLKDKWLAFHTENPRVRIRDAAKQLGTTEAEILAAFAGSSVIKLNNDVQELWQQMPTLGYVMVLTRNDSCVHERKGVFEKVSVHNPHVGVVVGEDIDLRMFFNAGPLLLRCLIMKWRRLKNPSRYSISRALRW